MDLRLARGGHVLNLPAPAMSPPESAIETYCTGCVYHPPNLPPDAYPPQDWALLQTRICAFEHLPGTPDCLDTRKTSCSLVDLDATRRAATPRDD